MSTSKLFSAENLTLDYCREKAMSSSPLQKQKLYYQTKNKLESESLTTNYFPMFNVEGKGSYQSDVIKLEFPFPGASSPEIPLDQYHLNLNVKQTIWDGGITSSNKEVVNADNRAKESGVEVSLFPIKEIINNLFFKILFVQQTLKILDIGEKQLDTNRTIIDSYVKNGVMYRSNLESISIEILRIKQNIKELEADRKSLIDMMSQWIEEPIDESVQFEAPTVRYFEANEIKRPEYELFERKQDLLDANKNLISTNLMPKIFAIGMGGYGVPNQLNFFETEGSFYWMVGLNLQWTPFDWSATSKREQSIEISKDIVKTERMNFDKNLNISLVKEKTDIEKLVNIIEMDEEIIARQKKIADEYFSRFENSSITVTDYLIQVNELIKARINLDLHKLQKLAAEVNLMTKTGNY